jgi:hypothetical protein
MNCESRSTNNEFGNFVTLNSPARRSFTKEDFRIYLILALISQFWYKTLSAGRQGIDKNGVLDYILMLRIIKFGIQ